jgi:dienelactone hydrolase
MAFRGTMQTGLQNRAEVAKAVIPVEKINAPVLLISAGDDQVWPSSVMADQIVKRLAEHRHAYADESLCYAAAGHEVLPPYHPTNASAFGYPGGGGSVLGGNPIANAFADEDSWQRLLEFLHSAF